LELALSFWFRWKHLIKLTVIAILCVLCALAFTPLKKTIHLGLDLQGGLRTLVELEPTQDVPKITGDLLDEELLVLQTRLNGLGVNELTFSKVGDTRINIEMPGLKDPEQAIALIREAAVLEMRPLTKAQVAQAQSDPKFDPYKWLDRRSSPAPTCRARPRERIRPANRPCISR